MADDNVLSLVGKSEPRGKPNKLIHIRAGAEGWTPSAEELDKIKADVEAAMADPDHNVVATRDGVEINVIYLNFEDDEDE